MNRTILSISMRNLIRQKRRSLLLGLAIAFGAMILVVANSFSRGISDVLFNEVAVYVAGHVKVSFSERGNYFRQIFYNKQLINNAIKQTIPDYRGLEESIGVFGRAIGNGKSDNVIVVGMSLDAELNEEDAAKAANNFKMVEGAYENLRDSTVPCPVILSKSKAQYLNVKVGDVIKVRFINALGQEQASRMTVVGVFKPTNMFMGFPVFVEMRYLKPLMGYGPNATAPVQLTLNNARRDAARLADSLHAKLTPKPALIAARCTTQAGVSTSLALVGFKDDSTSLAKLDSLCTFSQGTLSKEGVYLNDSAAALLGLSTGSALTLSWQGALDSTQHSMEVTMSGVCTLPGVTTPVVLSNPTDFYRSYYGGWPVEDSALRKSTALLDTAHVLAGVVAPQWELLPRARTSTDAQDQFRQMAALRSKAVIMDVSSMYESASAILKLEGALNIITVVAVIILYFIILIGVINTLRMSVKERTREIGTIRAIGMQRGQVSALFVYEATILALVASVVGSVMAFGVMWLLKLPVIDSGDSPMGMLLVSGHLHFVPSALSIIGFIIMISVITALTAWFPARKAGNLSPSEALRHFE